MNWLITGGCGFIGSALTRQLLSRGESVRVLDNLTVGRRSALPTTSAVVEHDGELVPSQWPTLGLVVGDIRDKSVVHAAARGAQVVIHLAANTGVMPSIEAPLVDFEVNARGTLNCLEAARASESGRFVLASSGAPLGAQEPPIHEEKAARPISPYGASKLAGEGYCSAYYGSFGVETVVLRFGNVYGPGSGHKQSVIAKFLRAALAGEELVVYGDGTQTRDFVYIDDIVEALTISGSRPGIGGELFQIATQCEHTINEVAQTVRRLVTERTGRAVTLRHAGQRRGEVRRNYSDISKARKMLDFAPRKSLEEGIAATLDDFLASTEIHVS